MEKKWNDIYKKNPADYKYYDINQPHQDMPLVEKELRRLNAKRVLDLGCGVGRNLFYLLDKGYELTGFEYAPEGLKNIREKLKKEKKTAELAFGSFYKRLPFKDAHFNSVVCVQSLQHGTEKEIRAGIKEIERVLAPKGVIFITLAGRTSKGKVRLFLVKTAKKIAKNTFVPTQGPETGLTHFIYTQALIRKHFRNFDIKKIWRDDKDYYCFIAHKK